jgi:hypothetical protein
MPFPKKNLWKKSRNGARKLSSLLDHKCDRYTTKMLGSARRPRRPDDITIVCRAISKYIRIANRMAKEDPHIYGPRADDYLRDTLKMERIEQAFDTAIRKFRPDRPPLVSTLWLRRYYHKPENRRLFLNWFHEFYPSRRSPSSSSVAR